MKKDNRMIVIGEGENNKIMKSKTKSQSILVYAALIAFVAAALIAMSSYIQRSIQGTYKSAGDAFGDEEF